MVSDHAPGHAALSCPEQPRRTDAAAAAHPSYGAEAPAGGGRVHLREDTCGLLVLRSYRSFSMVLIDLGLRIAIWSGSIDAVSSDFATLQGIVRALVTPLVALAVGVVVRASVTPLAWGLAMVFVIVTNPEMSPPPKRNTLLTRLFDQGRVAIAYRPLRWTTSVRDQAVQSLGGTGKVLLYADAALRGLAVLVFRVFVASIFLT